MSIPAPVIDPRRQADILADLLAHAPGFAPEWTPRSGEAATALATIVARYLEVLAAGLNQAPTRNRLAFLDMLGGSLLSAQAARAPLVFTLIAESPFDVTLPAESLVAATPPPPPPSPEAVAAEPDEPIVFATMGAVSLIRGKLATLFSVDPGNDSYADHGAAVTAGFALFADMRPVRHELYLGHDELFALAGEAEVRLIVALGAFDDKSERQDLELAWEYLSEDGWLPLEIVDDRTAGLAADGQVVLRKACGPDAKEEEFFGHTSYWLRGRLLTPLPAQGFGAAGRAPVLDTIRTRVGFTKRGLHPDAAFNGAFALDTGNAFAPFGQSPVRYATFYLASREVFQRRGARTTIEVDLADVGVAAGGLALTWEYFDGDVWRSLATGFEFQDGTDRFTHDGAISFLCPLDWAETEIEGETNYWLRARIDAGDYGHPLRVKATTTGSTTTLSIEDSTLAPPVIATMTLEYTYLTTPTAMDHCLSYNAFAYADHSDACHWPRQLFEPFHPLADRQPAVYLGFDAPLPSGLVSLYVHVPDGAEASEGEAGASDFAWDYWSARGWSELGVLDETLGFRRSGMIQFVGPRDAIRGPSPAGDLVLIRARLKQSGRGRPLAVAGIWRNAVWGVQQRSFVRDALGVSDGTPRQAFHFNRDRVPVLVGETIEVREWAGRGVEWEAVVHESPEVDRALEYDPATGAVRAVWVRWHGQEHLFDSGPGDRHYVLERATGLLRFGDGTRGLIPLAGSQVTATYRSGGGIAGNVPAGAISELRAAVPYVSEVTNPVAASGGAAMEANARVAERGGWRLRHRDRAIAAADYEWLARDASPAIVRARCHPIAGPAGAGERGWVTVAILPNGTERQPRPTPELRHRVQEHLGRRAPATVARRIRVVAPAYVPVGVAAEIVPLHPDDAARVESLVRETLNGFLHPCRGGEDGAGWTFGVPVHLSRIARLIEGLPGVDRAVRIGLRVEGRLFDEIVPVGPLELVAAGDHELLVTLGEESERHAAAAAATR